MADAETENLERLWALIKRFQFYIFGGLVLVLTTIFGFTYQHSLFDDNRGSVNAALFLLMEKVEAGESEEAAVAFEVLQVADDFPELQNLGAFSLVSLYVAEKNYDEAAALMRGALETTTDDGLRRLAALRLSEVLISDAKYDEAVKVLEDNEPLNGQLVVLFKERMGDAAFARGDYRTARAAYEEAAEVAAENNLDSYSSVLLIKIGALLSEEYFAVDNSANNEAAEETDNSDTDVSEG